MQTRASLHRHALDLRHDAAHGLAGKDQCVLANAGAQVLIFCFKSSELEGIFDRD